MWSWAHYVEFYKLVCVSVNPGCAHGGMFNSHGSIWQQMGPICVIVTALRVMHVFSHCATSTGGVVITMQCIHRKMSEGARAQCYQE